MDYFKSSKDCAIAIGNFDGFHLGHRKIIAALKEVAAERDLNTIVLTFTPNPRVYFDPGVNVICTDIQKRDNGSPGFVQSFFS